MKIEIKDITKKYVKEQVLRGISFEAESGSCIGILGGNGCGKSTLLSILAGVQKPDGGTFTADGIDLFADAATRSEAVGYVPQGTPLMEELSAKDNLRLWYDKKTLEKELEDGVLAMLGIPEFIKTPVKRMSGGMKKRLSIGCAIANRPPVLLLDEPGAALDLLCKEKIADYLRKYKQGGGILILTTHEVAELDICDRMYIIKGGVLTPFEYDGDVGRLVENL